MPLTRPQPFILCRYNSVRDHTSTPNRTFSLHCVVEVGRELGYDGQESSAGAKARALFVHRVSEHIQTHLRQAGGGRGSDCPSPREREEECWQW